VRILTDDTVAVAVDFQEKLLPAVLEREKLLQRTLRLLTGLRALGVPVLLSEQYPRGLGSTVAEVREAAGEDAPVVEKMTFSCADTPEFLEKLEATGRRTVLLFGVEAHVCVLQTALDLVAAGYRVALVRDCVSSRFPDDLETGLLRAQQEGILLTSSEAVLFELLRRAGGDTFKLISKLVK